MTAVPRRPMATAGGVSALQLAALAGSTRHQELAAKALTNATTLEAHKALIVRQGGAVVLINIARWAIITAGCQSL